MDAMTKKIKAEEEFKKDLFGYVSTLCFIVFLFMHLFLALEQYQCYEMNKFNRSVTLNSLPQIDPDILLTAKQFMNIEEAREYFLFNMDYLFQGAS